MWSIHLAISHEQWCWESSYSGFLCYLYMLVLNGAAFMELLQLLLSFSLIYSSMKTQIATTI